MSIYDPQGWEPDNDESDAFDPIFDPLSDSSFDPSAPDPFGFDSADDDASDINPSIFDASDFDPSNAFDQDNDANDISGLNVEGIDPNGMDETERMLRFAEIAATFGRSVAAFETSPWISGHDLLARHSIKTPKSSELTCDDALTDALWQIIELFAKNNIFLDHTDHLSERELYTTIVEELLDEPVKDYAVVIDEEEITRPGFWTCCYDLTEINSLDDGWLTYLKYYADDHERDIEARVCPDQTLPSKETPRFDRDRFLPRPIEERFAERGEVPPEEVWFQESFDV